MPETSERANILCSVIGSPSASPSQAFAAIEAKLASLSDPDRAPLRRAIIEALEATFEGETAFTSDWLKAILEASPCFIHAKDETRISADAETHEERLCRLLIRSLETKPPAERGHLINSVIAALADVSLLCALFRSVDGDWSAEHAKRNAEETYFGTYTESLRNQLLDRVLNLAETGKFWTQVAPSSILWFWWACGQEQQVYVFTKKSMQSSSMLTALLDVPVGRVSTAQGDYDVIQVRRWSKIIDFHTLEKHALDLALSAPSRDDRKRARRFLDAYANGKSELFR